MNAKGKLVTATAITISSYIGLIKIVDNLLVKKNWTLPDSLQETIANTDLSEFAKASKINREILDDIGYKKLCIMNKRGQKLTGWFIESTTNSDKYVLCCHGYRSEGRDEFSGIAQYYYNRGFNVLMVDQIASGDSEGNIISFGHYEAEDSLLWLDYLNKTYGNDITITLHGVSMGAATVMIMSGDKRLPKNVKMVVADCGYTSAIEEFDYKLKEMHLNKLPGILSLTNKINRKVTGFDFRDTDAHNGVRNAKVPMLFIHGGADLFVPTFMSEKNYKYCSSEIKDLLIIDGADHAQSYITDKEKYEAKIDEFMLRAGIIKGDE